MTGFELARSKVITALETAGITTFSLNINEQPDTLPCAIVNLKGDSGADEVDAGFLTNDYVIEVFIVVDADQVEDPDTQLTGLKEQFRGAYREANNYDIPKADYYPSMWNATKCKVARMELMIEAERDEYVPYSEE